MLTDNAVSLEQQKIWLQQFDVEDLSRALVRQFCLQNRLTQTLSSFETEDVKNRKKINKATVIRMLQMNNLVYWNKKSDKPLKSLLEVLVNYLKNKFKDRVQGRVEPSHSQSQQEPKSKINDSDFEDIYEKNRQDIKEGNQKSLSNTMNLGKNRNPTSRSKNQLKHEKQPKSNNQRAHHHGNKNIIKTDHPTTSVQAIYAELQKQDAKDRARLEQKNQQLKQLQEKIQEQTRLQKLRYKQLQKKIQQNRELENQLIRERRERQEEAKKIKEEVKKQYEIKLEKEKSEIQKSAEQRIRFMEQQREQKIKAYEEAKNLQTKQSKQKEKQIKERNDKNIIEVAPIPQKSHQNEQQKVNEPSQSALIEEKQMQPDQDLLLPSRKSGGMRKMLKKKSQKSSEQSLATTSNQLSTSKQKINSETKNQQLNQIQNVQEKQQENLYNNQTKEQAPKMVKMFGKKKKNQSEEEDQRKPALTKFQFDQNFVDQPIGAGVLKYQYEKLMMNKIILQKEQNCEFSYTQKKFVPASKKFAQKMITEAQSQILKKSVFQGGLQALPKAWQQGFILSPHPDTPYGLQQIQGGPCGIIAALQCFYLKHLLHRSHCASEQQLRNQILRENCLVAALTDILLKVKSEEKITLALPPKSFSGNKVDISSLRLVSIEATTFQQAFLGIFAHKNFFMGKTNHGVTVLLYSIIMTKGVDRISEEIDMKQSPLIGNHGHCTQQLVNLFITGRASSNCFDNDKILDSEMKLHGIKQKSEFGFLTVFETLKYIEVGKNLKNPVYPVWIICKQFHYHVIFSNHYLIAQNNSVDKFDIVYFDGLYNCADRIVITLEKYPFGEQPDIKTKDLPLIEQVMMTKWGLRKADWNGSIKIL